MITLPEKKYPLALKLLDDVSINTLFVRMVLEKKVKGSVYADNPDNPETVYVVHPYGMSMLYGEWKNKDFNRQFVDYALNVKGIRSRHEWMQAFPFDWNNQLKDLLGDKMVAYEDNKEKQEKGIVEKNSRVNFVFHPSTYRENQKNKPQSHYPFSRSALKIYNEMQGTVVPSKFWDSDEDFAKAGFAFAVYIDGRPASCAFSVYIHENIYEMGIETIEEFRSKGLAEQVCSAYIDYCLQNNFLPAWSCRYENQASVKLAGKLGFEPVLIFPLYRLSN